MNVTVELDGLPVAVFIQKNPHYCANRFCQMYSPFEEPYVFEVLDEVEDLDKIDEELLFESAVELLHESI